jgi:hypothetical protein
MNNHRNSQKGFTILVAVVTAGILLIIAMSIGGIALKEQVLSIVNKESQVAFYAADTGMECALYWDQKKGSFAPTTDANGNALIPTGSTAINCNNENITATLATPFPSDDYSYTFKVSGIKVGDSGVTTCSVVMVGKNISEPNKTKTDIYSYGYNTCDASLTRVERGIEGHY